MIPGKKILLYCANENQASEMRLRLGVWGFRCEHRRRDELKGLRSAGFDAALVLDSGNEPVTAMRRSHRHLRVVQMVSRYSLAQSQAHVVVYGDDMEELRENLKMAAARKRGPRKAEA